MPWLTGAVHDSAAHRALFSDSSHGASARLLTDDAATAQGTRACALWRMIPAMAT